MTQSLCVMICLAATALAACGGPSAPAVTVEPASGGALAEYAENINDGADRRRDAPLYEYFCLNALGMACPADIEARLETYAVAGAASRVDLADSFTRLAAAETKGDPAALLSEEEYLTAAYRVVLGRPADPGGLAENLSFLERTGERNTVLRSMLQSSEFRSQR
ncbi:MAG: DUF4214 domain-containing protein [Alphaproteobacteria bacterium]|nr:DUF4214 domain-containing protein [Alphaproteobacteria bacterium]